MHLPAHLPGPLRAAVGLVATATDEAKHLPDRAIELPMLAVSTALQLSLRAQQRYAQLTVRGDEALSRGAAGDDAPPWATFDEDVAGPGIGAESSVTPAEPARAAAPASAPAAPAAPAASPPPASAPAPARPAADPALAAPAADPSVAAAAAPARERPARKTPAKKTAAKRTTAARTAAKTTRPADGQSSGKGVSAPRHTSPSRFDTVGDE